MNRTVEQGGWLRWLPAIRTVPALLAWFWGTAITFLAGTAVSPAPGRAGWSYPALLSVLLCGVLAATYRLALHRPELFSPGAGPAGEAAEAAPARPAS
jgi:hypothetical protein